MTLHAMEIAQRSDVGLVRTHNEDYLAAFDEFGIIVVADGMGGHCAGEVASQLAVDAAAESLFPVQQEDVADDLESLIRVGQAAEAGNKAIFDEVKSNPKLNGMGTTIVLSLFRQDRIFYAHVGDSRIYRFRAGHLRRLTRDHSLIQQVMDQGMFGSLEEAKEAGIGENVLTRSLGLDANVEIDVGDRMLESTDIYLSCTDGLCGKVPDDEIREILNQNNVDLESMADQLLEAAILAGGRDNISLVLARKKR